MQDKQAEIERISRLFTLLLCAALRDKRGGALNGNWKVIVNPRNPFKGSLLIGARYKKQRLNGSMIFTFWLCAALRHKRGVALKGN